MGIYERVKGSNDWSIRFSDHGKIVREHVGMKSYALKMLALRQAEVTLGKFRREDVQAKHTNITLKQIFKDYLEVSKHKKYIKQLESNERFWLKKFGERSASSIKRSEIEKVQNDTRVTKKPATCNRNLACIRAVYNHAVDTEKLDKNPCRGIKSFQENNKRDRWLTEDEESRLLPLLPFDLKQAVIISMNTGLRKTEQFSLKWSDVDIPNKTIRVQESKAGMKGYIKMCQTVIDAFNRIPHKIGSDQVFWKLTEKDPNLFFKSFNKAFKGFLKEADIQNFKWHDFRHTFASRMAMKGKTLQSISRLMRHSNVGMTERYSHLDPMYLQDAVDCLDNWSQVTPEVTQTVGS